MSVILYAKYQTFSSDFFAPKKTKVLRLPSFISHPPYRLILISYNLKRLRPSTNSIGRITTIETTTNIKTVESFLAKQSVCHTTHGRKNLIDLKFISNLRKAKSTTQRWNQEHNSNHNNQAYYRISNHANRRFHFVLLTS